MSARNPTREELAEAAPVLLHSIRDMGDLCGNAVATVIAAGALVSALADVHGMALDEALDTVRECVTKTRGKLRAGMQ